MKTLLTGAFNYSEEQIEKLNSIGCETVFVQDERVKLDIDVDEIEAVVCNGLFLYNDISKFKNLKFIQLTSAGFDRAPMDYIKKHNITIKNARGVYSAPMAEWVVLKILEIYKNTRFFIKNQENKVWEKDRGLLELTDKVVTIVGCGSVGIEVAKRLKAFGCVVNGVGRTQVDSEYIDRFYNMVCLDEALMESDVVVLSVALTEETRHLFDMGRFEVMKDQAVLVNVSRGAVVDEADLVEALSRGKFMGVALDVMENEPLGDDSELWECDRVLVTPHNSFVSDRVRDRLFDLMVENLVNHLNNCRKIK